MPRRSYKKKRSNKVYGYTSQAVGPPTLLRKLRYCTRVNLDAGIGSAAVHNFKANGLYDPDSTGLGHQPLGFDQYMLMYDHFKVIGSKISVEFSASANNTTTTNRVIGAIYLDDDITALTDIEHAIEQGLTSYKVINSGLGIKPTSISRKYSSKVFNFNKKDSAELVGTAAADPADTAFFKIMVQALEAADNPSGVSALVVIDYIVLFSERKTLTQS